MEMISKSEIEALLDGRLSEAEAQMLLEQIDDEDLEHHFSQNELGTRMVVYRERNQATPWAGYQVPPAEVDRLWSEIRDSDSAKNTSSSRVWQALSDGIDWLRATLTAAPLATYAATLTLLLIIVIVPLQLVRLPQGQPPLQGVKGAAFEAPATLQFAIVGANGVLERPERPLRETDTLAFRISVEKSGYYSLYMVHEAVADAIIIDRLLSPGSHDLQEAYALHGNRGNNRLVLVYSDQSAPSGREPNLALIRQAAMSDVSALTISGRNLTFHTQLIEVQR